MSGPLKNSTYLKVSNVDYLESLKESYENNPDSVDPTVRYFFEGLELASLSNGAGPSTAASGASLDSASLEKEYAVFRLVEAFRAYGHKGANINPLEDAKKPAELEPKSYGLDDSDLGKVFFTAQKVLGKAGNLKELLDSLKKTFCGTQGYEFLHMQNSEARKWFQSKVESAAQTTLSLDDKKFLFTRLAHAEQFEKFLHTRYVAQKRFSVEGGDSIIPALDCVVETATGLGASSFVLGMAHRGRLNVLTHWCGKPYEYMFTEFEGTYKVDTTHGDGDVKYHKGYSKDFTTRQGKKAHLTLAANPSHLEFVNAVALGMARAKQQRVQDRDRTSVIPILIHGDAALAGQGVCYEVMNFTSLPGYTSGGTIHFVINNQVGFTTPAEEARSTPYSTDLALGFGSPVIHVNGDDAEAVWKATKLATEYRQKFKQDVFIDIVCYRKYGHNEGDEPAFTQPLMYKKIKAHPTPREIYQAQLLKESPALSAELEKIITSIQETLNASQIKAKAENTQPYNQVFGDVWSEYHQPSEDEVLLPVFTSVPDLTLKSLAEKICKIPATFHMHSKLGRFFEARLKAVQDGKGIDWGTGEALAYASLVAEGYKVRLSGQDAERGTFTHRHAILKDFETGDDYSPIAQVGSQPSAFEVYNSHLSETGVLGFEHGYSLSEPKTLTIWEAQFGDFANGAQVIIDQFIASSETKWQRMSGLTLLLPHGYEGQGPEHSSARLERFLQLAGRNNLFVCNLTTPAQIFHALRRQLLWKFRKPLVIMSPKSLLRHPAAISDLHDFSTGGFKELIEDPIATVHAIRRVILCTGKIYYELLAKRNELGRDDVAILRLEQMYPFPAPHLIQAFQKLPAAQDIVWVQEEPRNMGAWSYVFQMWAGGLSNLGEKLGGRKLRYLGRDVAASPAVGSPKLHEKEQKSILQAAFD